MSFEKNVDGAKGPLQGLRVVDLGMLFAGPLVATTLADLGADVIKIEHPKGDEVRKLGRSGKGKNLWWSVTSRNKRLLALDVSKPQGADVVRKLLVDADVFIENFRPGRVRDWGLDYESVRKINPGIVMLHMSGYGQTGPYNDRPGLGTLAEAFSGFAHATGEAAGPPTLPTFPLADSVAAITGAFAVMSALYARQANGGIGDEIDVSLYEPLLAMTGPMVINYTHGQVVANREGNRARWSTPRNAYRTKDDRWIAISSAADSPAMRLFKAIGREDLTQDPSFQTNPERLKRVDECDGIIADWIRARTQAEAMAQFREFDVLAGPVNDIQMLVDDPHVQARETLVEVDDQQLGRVKVQNVVPRFTNNPGRINWLGHAEIGRDTAEILREAGYDERDVARLAAASITKKN